MIQWLAIPVKVCGSIKHLFDLTLLFIQFSPPFPADRKLWQWNVTLFLCLNLFCLGHLFSPLDYQQSLPTFPKESKQSVKNFYVRLLKSCSSSDGRERQFLQCFPSFMEVISLNNHSLSSLHSHEIWLISTAYSHIQL